MKLDRIRVGDIVEVDRKGRRFHAEVAAKSPTRPGELALRPLERGVSYRTATARDVIAHWKRVLPFTGRSRSRPAPVTPPAYIELGEMNP